MARSNRRVGNRTSIAKYEIAAAEVVRSLSMYATKYAAKLRVMTLRFGDPVSIMMVLPVRKLASLTDARDSKWSPQERQR